MNMMKRTLAMLLALVMLIGLLPVMDLTEVFAAETPSDGETTVTTGNTTYVLAGSDFQPTDGSTATGVNLLNQILNPIYDAGYTSFDGFLFAGDYDYNYSSSTAGKNALQGAVKEKYPDITHEVYVEGNHDCASRQGVDLVANGTLSPSGANDAENYGVYVIHERDYMWASNGINPATIQDTATKLEAYLNAKRNAGYTKPIFVISHLPLHYSMRTKNDGDGSHANYIFDVLNEAGNAGLNIIFMFGHNHSNGWDDYLGGGAIYLAKGDKINIAQASQTVWQEETLAFTYMNAGYVSYYRNVNTGSETDLTMTVFEITDDKVEVKRFSKDGLHDVKSKGVTNSYKGESGYSPDTTVYASPQTITLNKEITPTGEEITPPSGGNTESGSTERTYTRVTSTSELVSGGQYLIIENGSTDYFMLPEVTSNSAGDRVGFAIESTSVAGGDTITGDYSAKEWTMTGSGTSWKLSTDAGSAYMEYQSSSRAYGRISSTNSSTFTIGGSANAFTFTTTTNGNTYVFDHGSNDLINGYVKDPEDTFYIYRMTDEGSSGSSVDTTGGDWVTITEPTNGTTTYTYTQATSITAGGKYVIVANSNAVALMDNNGSMGSQTVTISGSTMTSTVALTEWTFSGSSSGTIYNGTRYLRYNNNSFSLNQNQSSTVYITDNGSNFKLSGSSNANRGYSLYYTGSAWSTSGRNTTQYVRLYQLTDTTTTGGTNGLYGKIVDITNNNFTYNVANGTSAEDALAAVKAGITGYTSSSNTATTGNELQDSQLTWTLDPSYDGSTAGEYAVTIAYNGVTLGVAKVVVPSVNITGYSINPMAATVRQGASQSLATAAKITVTLEDGTFYKVPVTISMLSKDGEAISTAEAGKQTGLTVTYNGVKITDDFTLTVKEKSASNYPEYPDEGAVKVNKTATGIDFQSSGIAQVELSASGVPVQKGADVVIVIDTSSSMRDNDVGSTGKSRIEVLSESLEQMLIQFQQPNATTGMAADISVAIIDFNGYFNNSADTFDQISITSSYRNNADYAKLFTGPNAWDASKENYIKTLGGFSANDFVDITSIDADTVAANFNDGNCQSGTNYDGALENAYNLLAAKQAANGEEDRDAYVIFLSDGAPFRYNGYNNGSTKSTYNTWNNYLTGYWTQEAFKNAYSSNVYNYFYNGNGNVHPHLYAEAIKGTKGDLFDVISRDAANNTPAYMKQVSGLGATIYGIGFGLADDGDSQGKVSVATQKELIEVISSGDGYNFPNVQSADELVTAFTQIVSAIAYAANNARFVDQMGGSFNLQIKTSTYEVVENGQTITKTLKPKIEIISYDIYTKADANIPQGKNIGDRKGTYTVLETVTFSDDGTKAYSDQIDGGTTNILADGSREGYIKGVIYAKNFIYNTNAQAVEISGVNIPTGTAAGGITTGSTNVLPSETFYWKMGTVQTTELAMRYYVYLAGSMEGTKPAGSYKTNEFAILYYDNYLGNSCKIDTTSPSTAWKEANVSYAFYLVNEKGEIIVNQTTGETGSFANRIAVTNPVLYDTILLNNEDQDRALRVKAISKDVLPKYYELYDEKAVYFISIYSNGTGAWEIESGMDVKTTYVTQYDPTDSSAYSNDVRNGIDENDNRVVTGNSYTNTVVWFAVVWKPQAHPDSIVVDYGLPVDIHVLNNDMFGEGGSLRGIGATSLLGENYDYGAASTPEETLPNGFANSYEGQYGKAVADPGTGTVRYTLTTMQMNSYDEFVYAVYFEATDGSEWEKATGFYFDKITIIPATIIYYEDSFLTFGGTATWEDAGTAVEGAKQDEDRPGEYALKDANNIYGFDSVNKSMSQFSLGTAKKVTVDASTYGTAEFTFYGTGFDVISMTSNETGVLVVQVYAGAAASGTAVATKLVDTYYGYTQQAGDANGDGTVAEGEMIWVATPDVDKAIYQVPVIQVNGLTYGQYTVKITASYYDALNNDRVDRGDGTMIGDGSYDLYLDAIRIYDPANDGATGGTEDKTIEDAYVLDGEGWPSYIELRDKLIEAGKFGNTDTDTKIIGSVFIDGNANVSEIADYVSYGPNNEVYLAKNQSVAFMLSDVQRKKMDEEGNLVLDEDGNPVMESIVAHVHIGLKSANGSAVTYELYNVAKQDYVGQSGTTTKGTIYNHEEDTINTSTDMYYDLTAWRNDIIVITNTSDSILSITNIKATYKENPNGVLVANEETSEAPATFALARSAAPVAEETEAANNEVGVYMTSTAAAFTLRAMNTVPVEEPQVFNPEKLDVKVDKSTVKEGKKIEVTVTTSGDVEYITVNGEKITKYRTNRRTGERTFSVKLTAEEAGEMNIEVVAYNAEELASDPITETITVEGQKKNNHKENVKAFVDMLKSWIWG